MTTHAANRLPPHSKEAEQSVLGSMLCDNRTIDDLALKLRAADFYADANQKIYGKRLGTCPTATAGRLTW